MKKDRVGIMCGCGMEFPNQDPDNPVEYKAHLESAHPIEALKREPTQAEAETEAGLVRTGYTLPEAYFGRRGGITGRGAVALPGTRAGQIPLTRPDLSQLPEVVRAAQATSAAIQRENERIYDKLPHHELVMALLDRDSTLRLRDSENAALRVDIARVKIRAQRLSTRQHNMVHKATDAFYQAGTAFLALVKKFDEQQQASHNPPAPNAGDAAAYRVATEGQGDLDIDVAPVGEPPDLQPFVRELPYGPHDYITCMPGKDDSECENKGCHYVQGHGAPCARPREEHLDATR